MLCVKMLVYLTDNLRKSRCCSRYNHEQLRKLESEEVIQGYAPILNADSVGGV